MKTEAFDFDDPELPYLKAGLRNGCTAGQKNDCDHKQDQLQHKPFHRSALRAGERLVESASDQDCGKNIAIRICKGLHRLGMISLILKDAAGQLRRRYDLFAVTAQLGMLWRDISY